MHLKRSVMPTTWPISRKSKRKRFMAVPSHSAAKGITILYVLRDILKIAETRKEARKILHLGDVKINGIERSNDAYPVQVLDTISLEKSKQYYRLQIENKKFALKEISKKEIMEKIVKIIGKKTIDKKTIQINLEDGNNILFNDKCSVGDSVVLNSKDKKITKVLFP